MTPCINNAGFTHWIRLSHTSVTKAVHRLTVSRESYIWNNRLHAMYWGATFNDFIHWKQNSELLRTFICQTVFVHNLANITDLKLSRPVRPNQAGPTLPVTSQPVLVKGEMRQMITCWESERCMCLAITCFKRSSCDTIGKVMKLLLWHTGQSVQRSLCALRCSRRIFSDANFFSHRKQEGSCKHLSRRINLQQKQIQLDEDKH